MENFIICFFCAVLFLVCVIAIIANAMILIYKTAWEICS